MRAIAELNPRTGATRTDVIQPSSGNGPRDPGRCPRLKAAVFASSASLRLPG